MKAGRIVAPRSIELVDLAEPKCGPGEVIVQLEYACLCGTDSPYFAYDFDALRVEGKRLMERRLDYSRESLYPMQVGLPMHECVGMVIESRYFGLAPGDFVLAFPAGMDGFQELLLIPGERVYPLPLKGVPKEEMLLCQPLGTILYGFRKLPELRGKSVAVVGQGPIGQLMNAELARLGARNIIGIDKLGPRLEKSRAMGATSVINASEGDMLTRFMDINQGDLADVVIEAVGHVELAVNLCMDLVAQDGQILVFGAHDADLVDDYPSGVAMRKNVSVHHSIGAWHAEHFLPAAEMIANRVFDLSGLITHRFPIARAQEAFETFVDRKDGCLKVLLEF